MYDRLAEICGDVEFGGEIKAMILSGSGDRSFAAGTDISQFQSFSDPQDAFDYERKMEVVLQTLEKCPVPTIAAIAGACTGGGAAIAAACDIRLCDQHLKFGFPIARTLGNCLSVRNLNRVVALVGHGRTTELMLTARLMGADEALNVGLVSEVLPDKPAVEARAMELGETLTGHAPLTMRAAKEALRRLRDQGPDADDSDLIAECYSSKDFQSGISSFLEKRRPDWTGK